MRLDQVKGMVTQRMLCACTELLRRIRLSAKAEDGMSTVEYAIGTVAAAAFGAVLYTVVTGDNIVNALTEIVDKALNTKV